MRLLSEILLSPVSGPIRMFDFIAKRVNEQVEAEYLDEGKVQAQLLELTLRYQRGDIDDDQYKEQEAAILQRLNDIRAYKESASSAQVEANETGDASDQSEAGGEE